MNKRTTYALLSVLVLLLVLFASSGAAWATTFANPVDAGYGHITNSVYLSRADFPDGAPAAVLAGSESYTDSLTATVLAKAANGPLLLTSSTSLSTSVRDELVRLKVTNIFIVGLSTTIVNAVKTALPTLASGQIVGLTGGDLYQTAALVAGKVKELTGATPARAFIVPGDVYGSSLAAAAVAAANGWPILLTPAAGPFPSASAQAIVSLGVKTGIRVDTSVNPGVSGFTVEKTIMGTTSTTDDPGARYTEALAMAEYAVQQGWATYAHVALGEEQGGSVAYSENFPDNVLLASHIAREGGAYLLSRSTALHSTVVALLKEHGTEIDSVDFARPDYDQVLSGAWSFGTIRQVKSLNSPRVTGLSKASGPLGGGGALTVTGSGFTGATTVRIGKTDLPAGSWKVNSDTSLTIDALPAAPQPEAAEILVYNYWHVSPSNPSDVYFYVSDTWPEPAAMKVVREAVKYLGTPYVWAGASTSGFDCSGFTMYVYNKFTSVTGVTLPHKSTYQANYGTPVDVEDLLPGDLVFFYSPIAHVGMYVGGGLMINSPRSGDLVTIEDVYRTSYTTARRLIAPAYTKVEDTSTLLAFSGTWGATPTSSASGGSYAYSDDATGASVTVTFDGIYLRWIATRGTAFGLASVSVDGTPAGTVNLYSSATQYKQKVWDTGVLPQGTHTVTITRTGTGSGGGTNIGLDAFEVLGTVLQNAAPPVVTGLNPTSGTIAGGSSVVITGTGFTGASAVTFGGTAATGVLVNFAGTQIAAVAPAHDAGTVQVQVTTTNGASADVTADDYTYVVPSASTRYEQTNTNIVKTGTWADFGATGASGGSYGRSSTAGATATIYFTGTKIAWIGMKGITTGIVDVYLDSTTKTTTIDLTATAASYNLTLWTSPTLADTTHYLRLVRATSSGTGKFMTLDAVDIWGNIDAAPLSGGSTRYDQTNGSIVTTGIWADFPRTEAYLGSYGRSSTAGATATIYFTGTKIAWIGMKGTTPGVVDVYLDDVKKATLDLVAPTAAYQVTLWTSADLANTTHHMDLVRNAGSLSTEFIVLDAVDIWGHINPGP